MRMFENPNHPEILSTFQKEGYSVVKNILATDTVTSLRREIESQIDGSAKQLACTKVDYLAAASRWVAPSPVTTAVTASILEILTQAAQEFIQKPVQLKKMNVICKNAHCTGPIAYHQDISYSPLDPYEFSMWIALDDVSQDSAPLEVIPGSHLLPLKPAVDFWSPHYKADPSLKLCALKLSVQAGDAIFFDSRLWHGSGENKNLSSRYALVVRWISEGWKFDQPIPSIEPGFFGMWTGGKMTEDLLSKGLDILVSKSASGFVELIDTWVQIIQEGSLPFVKDKYSTLESFKNLKILHLAHAHHNGGDATGTVYKIFWQTFLSSLGAYLVDVEKKRNVG